MSPGPPRDPADRDGPPKDVLLAVIDATADLVHVKDLEGRYLLVNQAVADFTGRARHEIVGRTPSELFGSATGRALTSHDTEVLADDTAHLFEETIVVGDRTYLFSSSKAPVKDADGNTVALVGISREVTHLRRLEAELAAARRVEAEDRFGAVLDAMLDLVTIIRVVRDTDGRVVDFEIEYMNPVNVDIAGRPREELMGRSVLEAYPAMAGSVLFDDYVRAVETQRPVIVHEMPWQETIDGVTHSGAYAVQIVPFGGGLVVASRDISEDLRDRRRLSDAYEQLNAAQVLAHIGIWTIDLDTGVLTMSDELSRIFGLEPGDPMPVEEALRTIVHPSDVEVARSLLAQMPQADEPITAELRILRPDGTIRQVVIYGTRVSEDPGGARLWGTAQDVTQQRRAEEALRATSISLAREHHGVMVLQQAILPALEETTRAEASALYLPAGGESQVGGDWYDAFDMDQRRIGLVVGDVAGHGLAAGGLMAQLRNALRAHAFYGLGPGEAFTAMNSFMRRTSVPAFATCLYAVVNLEDYEVTFSRAGHPPLIRHRGGEIETFERMHDPPLGAVPDVTFQERSIPVEPGDLLVLYTDGLIERRGELIDLGMDRLTEAIVELADLPLDELCQQLCERLLGDRVPTDDLCVLALRVP